MKTQLSPLKLFLKQVIGESHQLELKNE